MTDAALNAAVRMRGASQLRRRWRSWMGLALLIGLTGGFVVASVAGARRTTTAYDRLLESARPFDVALGVECDEERYGDVCGERTSESIDEILRLPEVEDGARLVNFLLPVLDDDGFSIQPQDEAIGGSNEAPGVVCFTGSGEVDVLGSPNGRFGTELNRFRYVAGRAADPSRADEVVVSIATARRAGIHVGDTLSIVPVDACGEAEAEAWPDSYEVTVVGLHVAPGEVQPESGRYLQSVTVTPPLLSELSASVPAVPGVMVRLRGGSTTADLMDATAAAHIDAVVIFSQEELTESVRRGLRPDAMTLWLLAALGGAASVIVLGQALSRQAWAGADELPALRSIGFTRRELTLVGAVEGGVIAMIAGICTAALAIAVSPLFPISRARVAEPDPGIRIDVLAVGIGALIVALATFAVVVMVTRLVAVRTTTSVRPSARPGVVATMLRRLGARPTAIHGARMALERGHGARAVPVRTGFVGIAVGIAALVGSLTFGADLEHLLASPRLVGWNWDVAFSYEAPEDPEDAVAQADELLRAIRAVEGVDRAGYSTFFPPNEVPLIDALPEIWPLSFSTGPGSIAPTVTSGRAPAGPDEILVTRVVLTELGLDVGDALELNGVRTDDSEEPIPITADVTIVGTGVMPIGDGAFEHTVALTYEGMQRLAPGTSPQLVVVDFAANVDEADATTEIHELGAGDALVSDGINVPALVDLDVKRADDLPRLLGGLMGVLAIGVLIHLVYTGVRAGRHELALLRALGFTCAQVVTTVAWQTTIAIVAPFLIAALIGTVAGGAVWIVYAERLGVATVTVIAWAPIGGFLVSFLVGANLLALLLGRGARRTKPAEVLRTE